MTTSRIMPDVYGPQAALSGSRQGSDRIGWIKIAITLLILYFFFSACVHIQIGTATKFDLIIVVIIGILSILSIGQDSAEVRAAKQKWKDTSKFADVAIVSRGYRPSATYYDEYEIPHTVSARYTLTLMLLNQTIVKADVSGSVYRTLENRNTVSIYYKPESPITFMLEEEL